jgi:hypothetical protein
MTRWLVALADLLTVIASVLYVRATVLDTAQPEIVSWAAWAALLAESTAAEITAWNPATALYTGICALACITVTVLSLRRGSWVPSRLDWFSMGAVGAGLILLLVVRSPVATVLVTVTADFAAYLPTMRHAWREPDQEPALVYALFGAGAGLTLYAASRTIVGAAYPFYLTAADTLVVAFIVIRRRQQRAELARLLDPESMLMERNPDLIRAQWSGRHVGFDHAPRWHDELDVHHDLFLRGPDVNLG